MNNLEPAEPFKRLFERMMEIPKEDLDAIGATYEEIVEAAHGMRECDHDMGVRFDDLGMFCSDCGEYITDDGEYIPNHYGEE